MPETKRIGQLCKESPVFRDVLIAVLRGEAGYCQKTGKIHYYVKRKKVIAN